MVARSRGGLDLGVCVATAVPNVGERVPHVEACVGAVATQARTSVIYGVEGLRLLRNGLSPMEALKTMLSQDPEREHRQVAIIDVDGRKAAFTGKETPAWKGHIMGENYVAAGNILAGEAVLKNMVESFKASEGMDLAERLMRVLEAGQCAGGDRRGKRSAALLVKGVEPPRTVDLRVDDHEDPVAELRKLFEAYRPPQGKR